MLYNEELVAYTDQLKKNAEAFLKSCGKAPIEIYRIENFTPVMVEEAHHGQFYDGDSYVCIVQTKVAYDIHYWEGVDSTADETGSAAAFTTELSENLLKPSKHHLELMHEESDLFLSNFKNGIKYLHGGFGSGFKHVVAEVHTPELLRVKGKRYPRVFPVPVAASSLCNGDVYILDLGQDLYYWCGAECNEFEKVAALNYAVNVKNQQRFGKSNLNYPQDMGGDCEANFWKALSGS